MARSRKPTADAKLDGNPGNANLSDRIDGELEAGAPDPPVEVLDDPDALAEWRRIVPIMDQAKMLHRMDLGVLVGYVTTYATLVRLRRAIKDQPFLIDGTGGTKKENPIYQTQNKYLSQFHKYLTLLGLSPTTRSRIARAADPPDPEDEIDAILRGG